MHLHTSTDTTGTGTGAERAFQLLRTVFTIAPIAFGLDKFAEVLTDWEQYLAPWINDLVPGSAHQAMLAVGVIEVVAGITVAVAPRFGTLLVSKGAVEWRPTNKVYRRKLNWTRFDQAMRESGRKV